MSDEIVLVGPALPYRGGIAQYNTLLFRQLRALGLATVGHSFKRQYPHGSIPAKATWTQITWATSSRVSNIRSIPSIRFLGCGPPVR